LRLAAWLTALTTFLVGLGQAHAQTAPAAAKPSVQMAGGAEAGMEVFDGPLGTLSAWWLLDTPLVEAGLWLPLRMRASGEGAGRLRRQDWDERSDWGRLVRFVDVRQPNWRLHAGELRGTTLGHGSLVRRFYNTLDYDTWHTGLSGQFDLGVVGAEAVLDDVLAPGLVGLRGFARPDPGRRLTLGLTMAGDLGAPKSTGGDTVRGHLGGDVQWQAVQRADWGLAPYLDVAGQLLPNTAGAQVHIGVLWTAKAWGGQWRAQAEGRWARATEPVPYDIFYLQQRFVQPASYAPGKARSGWAVDLAWTRPGASARLAVDASSADGYGVYGWLSFFPQRDLSLDLFAGERHIQGVSSLWQGDAGPVLQSSARLQVTDAWFAAASVGRFWRHGATAPVLDLDAALTVGARFGP
jgi:hypothetical protein